MNKTFKTIWNEARRCYIVANEAQKSHGKPSKSAVALAVAATALFSSVASAAYVAQNHMDMASAVASWEDAEYQKDWGLGAMNASTAYALGFNGNGVAVGVMDSGALLQKHSDLAGDRFHASEADSSYGSAGNRYPQDSKKPGKYDPNTPATESGKIDGNWIAGTNDSHGTHVTGTVGGNRDGNDFHGVAWGSDVWVGNTGGTDSTNYGPFQDYKFFYNGWSALAKNVADNNLKKDDSSRGGFINNSFGTNTRVEATGSKGPDGGNTSVHLPVDTLEQMEYEYFLFRQLADANYENADNWGSFVDAAYEAVKDKGVVQIFTTGNRDFANPFYRPLFPYYKPEAEKNWIAVAGMKKGENNTYELYSTFNEAGLAKYWTVAAPGSGIWSSKVDADGNPYSGNSSGTSMAAPHVAGAAAVLMSRYKDMDAVQIRDVLFTTASHKNPDGTNYKGWTAEEGQVDERYGWGMPDLDKGMYGLGQLLGEFKYNMTDTALDVWSNDISQVALNQRKDEEKAWKADAEKWQEAYTKFTDNGSKLEGLSEEVKKTLLTDITLTDEGVIDPESDVVGIDAAGEKIALEDALKWRNDYYENRLVSIDTKLANDEAGYKGTLIKQGQGRLVLTGNNTYEGTTTVEDGELLAFTESIGTDNKVTVKDGGAFGVLSSYNDTFTMKGQLISEATDEDKLTINVEAGGTLLVDAGSDVSVEKVDFAGDKKVKVGLFGAGSETLAAAYKGDSAVSGSITSDSADFTGIASADIADTNSAFFKVSDKTEVSADGKTLGVAVESNGKKFADFATTSNGLAIASALVNGPANDFTGSVLSMDEANVKATYEGLSDDMYATARNAFAVNSLTVSRTVIEQARSYGEGRAAEFANGQGRVWATASGQWMNADGNTGSMDVDFGAGFVGGEWIVTENTKVGAYFGYGTTKYDGNVGKIDGSDLHYGIYGMSDFGPTSVTYGFGYTTEDRDSQRTFMGTTNAHSEDATAMQAFAEVAYTGLNLGTVNVAPYLGVNVMRIETDGFTEMGQAHQFKVDDVKDDIQVANIGARVTVPFSMGKMPVALKADVGYSRFFGDTESISKVQLGQGGAYAAIEGKELEGQANVGLGINAQLGKAATVGISYTGAFGSDTDTHGIGATLRVNF